MFALLLWSALAGQTPQLSQKPPGPPRFEIFTGVMGGVRPDTPGGGGVGLLGLDVSLTRWLKPELMVGLGGYSGPGDVVTLFRIGTQLVWPTDARLKPALWLAFAHNHETGFADAKAHPVSSALGLSEDGVNHRSGFTAGLGIAYDLPMSKSSGFSGRLHARLAWTELLGVGPPRYFDAMVGVGVCF